MLMHRNDALSRCIVPTACVVVFPERLGFAGAAATTAESAGGAALAAKGGLGEQQQQQQQQQTGGARAAKNVWFAEDDRLERFYPFPTSYRKETTEEKAARKQLARAMFSETPPKGKGTRGNKDLLRTGYNHWRKAVEAAAAAAAAALAAEGGPRVQQEEQQDEQQQQEQQEEQQEQQDQQGRGRGGAGEGGPWGGCGT